jgi:hypothetical protein
MFLIDHGTLDACRLGALWQIWSENIRDIWPIASFHSWLAHKYPQEFLTFRAKMRVLGLNKLT